MKGAEAEGFLFVALENMLASLKVVYIRGMKRTNIYLTDPSVERLKALSKQTGLSVAELIRRAIDDFLKKQK